MQEQMRLLIDLQEIDVEMGKTRQQRVKCEEQLNAIRADRQRVQDMVESLTAQLDELDGERRQMELALTQERENLGKGEGRLPGIKTQKEYVAVLKEIDTAKKMVKELEEQLAAKTEEIDALSKEKEEKDADLAALVEKEASAQDEIKDELEQLETDLSVRADERKKIFGQIKAPLRKRYDLLCSRREGLAVVEALDGACLGCNMHLPPQLYNSLFRVDEIRACPHCNRLIYVQDAT